MNLADRLASAQRDRGQPSPPSSDAHGRDGGQPQRSSALSDPLAVLKQTVHQALLANLGPKLYDADLPSSDV